MGRGREGWRDGAKKDTYIGKVEDGRVHGGSVLVVDGELYGYLRGFRWYWMDGGMEG